MRTSIAGSLFLLAGAGAVAVAAADTTGNNLNLNGSDTLFEVTKEVLSMCPGASGRGIQYLGGGSGVGIGQQQLGNQRVSPGSRSMKNSEYCAGTASGGSAANSEALLLGIDGISVVTNKDTSCSSALGAANGLGRSFTVPAGTYTVNTSFDVLDLLYFGLHNGTGGSTAGAYDCNSAQRKALVGAWQNLFRSDCSSGAGICTTGLTHAWRRADVSGTADAFVGILNPPGKGLGTLSNVPTGKSRKKVPFCNSHDANNGTSSFLDEGAPTSFTGLTFWSASDMQDEDPIRVNATPNTTTSTTGDTIARGFQVPAGNFKGTLGMVLPILPPDAAGIGLTDAYPAANCSTFCDLVPVIKGAQIPAGYTCVDGTAPTLGGCYQPIITQANPDPRCIATNSTRCFGVSGSPDGRAYNMATVVLRTQIPTANQAASNFTYQYALDANKRIMTGSYYRIHMRKPSPNAAPNAALGQTGICQEPDATQQIGCLVDADRCSAGFAGREAAQDFPGLGSPPNPPADQLKALALDAPGVALTPPFTPDGLGGFTDQALKNLTAASGTTPFYPLSRRLYLHTMYGFGDAQLFAGAGSPNPDMASGERELVKCYHNPAITTVAISDNGFVIHTDGAGNIECLDYPEDTPAPDGVTTFDPPPANTQGPGNVALPGCGVAAGTGHNACTDAVTAP
jgi:ABC-type phosphate transport system substrate-binding protein